MFTQTLPRRMVLASLALTLTLARLCHASGGGDQFSFRRGDFNSDGDFDVSDVIGTLDFLFLGAEAPRCLDAADTNDDGELDIVDVLSSLMAQFTGAHVVPRPGFDACGVDPTPDALGCSFYVACDSYYDVGRRFEVAVVQGYDVRYTTADTVTPEREVPILIRYPLGAPGPLPVILWSHGGGPADHGHRRQEVWGNTLARVGYAVIHMSHTDDEINAHCAALGIPADECSAEDFQIGEPSEGGTLTSLWYNRPRDASAVLDDLANIEAHFRLDLDPGRVAVGGWSGGAHTVMTLAGALVDFSPGVRSVNLADPRFRAFLANSPQGIDRLGMTATSWDGIALPVLVQTGRRDNSAREQGEDRIDPFRYMPPGDKYLQFLDSRQARHPVFGLKEDGSRPLEYYVANAGIAFFDAHLLDLPEARTWLESNSLHELSGGISTMASK